MVRFEKKQKFNFQFKIDEESIKICFQKGEIPIGRCFHSAVYYKERIYIFGGINFDSERIFSSLYSYNYGINFF